MMGLQYLEVMEEEEEEGEEDQLQMGLRFPKLDLDRRPRLEER